MGQSNLPATTLIYRAAGSPVMRGELHGICRTCGSQSVGAAFADWVKDSFNDGSRLVAGEIVCHACLFSFEEKSELIARLTGKEAPQKFRSWSWLVLKGDLRVLSKGQKDLIFQTLVEGPEVAVIATSGQKHLAFKAKAGWWQIEEQSVLPFPDKLRQLSEPVTALYHLGASKEEIETGRYSPRTIQTLGIQAWNNLENQIKPHRGGTQLQLAVYLAQKAGDDAREDCK